MDLSSLAVFRAVAAERSVTRASQQLGRAPSNVTVRIQQLEQELDVLLFSRDGRRMRLTREGETFLVYADRLLALAAEARQALKRPAAAGSFRLGSMESTAASRLPDLLTRFRALWPDVSLQLSMGATRDLAKRVLDQELDCALIAQPAHGEADDRIDTGFDPARLDAVRVFVEDLLIVLPASHPPIGGAADIKVDTLAALEPGCTYRRLAERWVRGGTPLRTQEVGSYHAMLASVTAGNAIGVMPRSVLDLMQWPETVSTHPLCPVDTLLISRKDARSPLLDGFRGLLGGDRPLRT